MKIVVLFAAFFASAFVHNTTAFAQSSTPVWECDFETIWGYQEAHLEETIETTSTGPLVAKFIEANESEREIVVLDPEGNRVPGTIETYQMRYEERISVSGDYQVFRELLVAWTPDSPLTENTYTLDAGQRFFRIGGQSTEIVVNVIEAPIPPVVTEAVSWEIGSSTSPRISCDPLRRCKSYCSEYQPPNITKMMTATFDVTDSRSIARHLLRVAPSGEKQLEGDWISDKGGNWITDRPLMKDIAQVAYGSEPSCFRVEVLNLVDKTSQLGEIRCFDAAGGVIDLDLLLEEEKPEVEQVPEPIETPETPASEQVVDSDGCSAISASSSSFLVFLGLLFFWRRR